MSTDGLIPVPDDLEFGQTIRGFVPGQQVLGRYTLRDMVGRGGMGLVWLAHDEHLQEDVALKFLPELVRLDAISLEELKRETRRSRKLAHPNIVKVYDFSNDGMSAAISMEYVPGATLSGLRADRENLCFEADDIRDWLRQLLSALSYAHEDAKVVHRDLKPANIMVDQVGKLKVTDFGIASSISESVSRVTVQRGTSGTITYMSPQQALGDPPSVTDDIYSLGATIYELLTSKPPFYSGDIPGQIRDKVPPSMTQRRAQLGVTGAPILQDWEATIAACMAKRPEDRPQDIAEVAHRMGLGTVSATSPRTKAVPPAPMAAPLPPVPVIKVVAQPTVKAPIPIPMPVPAPMIVAPPEKSHNMMVTIVILLLIGGACFAWYFGVEQPAEKEKLRQAEIAQQEAIQKEKDLEAQATVDAAEKERLQAEAQKAADEAAQLKTEAEKAKQAADDAAVARALADKQAADNAAAAKALADKQAADAAAAAREAPITISTPLDELQRRSEAGESSAQAQLGYDYATGTVVTKDYQQALSLLQKSSDQGNACGQENLGFMYENGHGVPTDYTQAFSWYEKSAAQGNDAAEAQLGMMYQHGEGVAKDYSQAFLWFQKAAAQENVLSENQIGYLYEHGYGVAQDYSQALLWYQKAAAKGFAMAENQIGNLYLAGDGVEKNRQTAIEWYRKAAVQGNAYSIQSLKDLGASQ